MPKSRSARSAEKETPAKRGLSAKQKSSKFDVKDAPLGDGAVKKAADKLKTRKSRLDAAIEAAGG